MRGQDPVWIDAAGAAHRRAEAPARIACLVPSLTELLFDLGLGDRVVARTSYCVRPAGAVEQVPSVGGTKKIAMDRLRRLRPTHAVVNVDENPRAMAEALAAAGIEVVVTHPADPLDNAGLYRLFGGLFGADAAAEALCVRFDRAHRELTAAARGWPERRVLYLVWNEPWMTVNEETYIARTLALARMHAVGGEGSVRYPAVAMDAALLARVDWVLFPTEPYAFTEADRAAFASRYGIDARRLHAIDGELASWYGSRAIASLAELRLWRERLEPRA